MSRYRLDEAHRTGVAFRHRVWNYSLSWITSGGTASFDGVGNVNASGSMSWNNENSPPSLPSTLTVTPRLGPPIAQQINW